MLKFIGKRIISSIALLFVTSTLAFFLFSTGTKNAAYAVLGTTATDQNVANFNREHNLDVPIFEQYLNWLLGALRFDLGLPWTYTQSSIELVTTRLAVSATILGIAMVLAAIAAIFLGVSAARRGGWVDRLVQAFGIFSFVVPNYIIALILISIFAIQLRIFAATGWLEADSDFGSFINVATLPVVAVGFTSMAMIAMQIRGSVVEALQLEYVRVLQSRGLSTTRVLYKHVLRNVAGPALTIFGMQFIGMLGGLVVIEQIFAIPGFGSLTQDAAFRSDLPALMALVVATSILVVIVNLTTEIISALLNPKVRLS